MRIFSTLIVLILGLVLGGSFSLLDKTHQAAASSELLPSLKKGEPLPADAFIRLAKIVNPTVVNINTSQLPRQQPRGRRPPTGDPFFDLFEQFMGPSPFAQRRPVQSLGTGFIIRKDGLIITNNHVIDRADIIQVQLDEKSDQMYDAKVIGTDTRTDIALIKIEVKKDLPVARLGNSSQLEVGEWVAAFGNPYGHGHTMTKGIISAIGREIEGLNLFPFLQTDASINPGNSGGPLVNMRGEVIGVNTAIDARAQGIGFAIPVDNVKSILPQLEKEGQVRRGFIGVYMTDIDKESAQSLDLKQTEGALITQIISGSPAEKAGLQPYDLIVEFNKQPIRSTRDLGNAVIRTPVGQEVDMSFIRNGKKLSRKIQVVEQEAESVRAGGRPEGRSYQGHNAPFDFGFRIADYSRQLGSDFGIPQLQDGRPVVIEVEPNSPASQAGLAPGDVILDVNRHSVRRAQDVLRRLREGTNILRVLKQDRVVLIQLRP